MKISIYISDQDLEEIDAYCKKTGIKRSTLLVRTTMEEIESTGIINPIKIPKTVKEVKKKLKSIQQKKELNLCEHGMMKGLCKHGCK